MTVGVGIVGLSARNGWAFRSHLPALRQLDGFAVRALSASSVETAREAALKYGVERSYGTAEELADDDGVDLVVACIRVPAHREVVRAALAAGKMVLSEWPLGNGAAEAEELAAEADARGLRTFVGLQARAAPVVRHLRDLVAGGYVGEVLSTTVVASGGNWGSAFPEGAGYLMYRANGATMTTIPFGHLLDALVMVLGDVADATATEATRHHTVVDPGTGEAHHPDIADHLVVGGTLESGAVMSVHYRGGSSRGTNFHWEINGTDGDLVVSGDMGHIQMGQFRIAGARGEETRLRELVLPERLFEPALQELRGTSAYNVGAAYAQVARDLASGGRETPDFAHAARHQRLLDRIERTTHRRGEPDVR